MAGSLNKMRPRTAAAGVALTVAGLLFLVPATRTAPLSLASHHVRLPANAHSRRGHVTLGWTSSNWSGYAVTGSTGTFHSVTGQWTVPSVSASSGATYSSSWVGIDGFNDSNLIQTGTEQDYYNGAAHYYAWWEILPAAETVISGINVNPGDTITASISRGANGTWTIQISDGTQTSTTTHSYSGQLTSAEWIEEAPSVGGRIARLAHYSLTDFDPGTANGSDPRLVSADGGVMIQSRTQVSTPSRPDSDTDGFNVQYGSSTPSAPSS
jgi:Peptidase A4 family